ncbi:MAG: hypothetical protein ACXV5H_07275 [Halobacteriota archaeon]
MKRFVANHIGRNVGVDRSHYKHKLPEHVYDIYMWYWGEVRFD